DQDYYGIEMDVYDSYLEATSEIAYLISDTADVNVNLINSTMGPGSISLTGEALFNVSWYLNLTMQDGGMAPLDCALNTYYHGGDLFSTLHMPDGEGQLILTERSIYETGQKDLFFDLDLVVQNDGFVHYMLGENMHIDDNSDLAFILNLPPYNEMPEDIEFDEDEAYEVNLSEFFHDLENDLTYETSSGPDLDPKVVEGLYPLLTIETAENDWNGASWVVIEATDGGGNATSANVTVNVHPVNDAPRFTADIPEFKIIEEGTGYFNFTGIMMDPEGDAMTWTIPETVGLDLDWDEDNWNLTFTGIENWFGLTGIDVNVTDGEDWINVYIEVNVTPVNDIPTWSLMLKNGTEAPMAEYVYNETTNWTVYLIETDEDVPVEFWIDASDIETAELLYSFGGADLLHGTVDVEVYQIEVIVNATTNETEMQNVTVPMNFTYTPLEDDSLGDVVMFNVTDGEDTMSYKVWFRVAPVNDPPVFTAPSEWNTTADLDTLITIDMADWISDVDGDALTISTDSEYVTVNGTHLEILYNDTFVDDLQTVTVTVGDGTVEITAILTVNVNQPAIGDDDDEPVLGTLEITSENDGWLFEVTGDEGQTLFVVIEDEDGNLISYPMTYTDDKYSVVVGEEDAGVGLSYHLSDEEDGGSLGSDQTGSLTDLASETDDEDDLPLWIFLMLAVIVILVIIILAVVMSGGKGKDDIEE
ncbi:MAG: hypothetical protein KAH57_07950, partial [Thermoplasmata archaeon]|nr:hypothetical protein [Thermoplasmata archaeon]